MNKQQLASKIWASANNMRSKIEANEYKDYILGFIFYKFLSDKEEKSLKSEGWTEEDLKESLIETDQEMVKTCQARYGYFISYDNLFSTWLKEGKDFDVSNVRDALSAFKRCINENHKRVFDKIFDTLDTGLSKLGDNAGSQTKAISSLLSLIDPIPMDNKQGYDVLGFIYEYLISMFAANAGKKAGEFYTPHEVSLVMSQIVANHLKGRSQIEIYDPTSGSGSLLINIGQSVAKYLDDKNKIKYYAQELKENTYSLTRMNLIMKDVKPENIVARNGDTLADDWPYFDDGDKENTYQTLWVDAVVSNPPYSQKWEPKDDARFRNYGIAPKSKADYAFLLHDLYHLKNDGIMTIVLPHGVLFRGGEEGQIRKNLIENDNIDTIIGLPANIFFGTGIPTIIMVLKKQRDNGDVLIVDASKGFIKEGKNNKLRSCDIKKIVDTVIKREKRIDKYSRLVSKDEIRKNDYNLNIPRYVDSSEKAESFDIYATMYGGIPNKEIDELKDYWKAFPSLRNEIFSPLNSNFSSIKNNNVKEIIDSNRNVIDFINSYSNAFSGFDKYLDEYLIKGFENINVSKAESLVSQEIFNRFDNISLIDKYTAYQLLADRWTTISTDLEVIKTEGIEACRIVDPIMVVKKVKDKETEVQKGSNGRVIPFDLVQSTKLLTESTALKDKENRLTEISNSYTEILEELSEDDKEEISDLLSEENDAFVSAQVAKEAKEIKKNGKIELDSLDSKIITVNDLFKEEKELKKVIKNDSSKLEVLTEETIKNLSNEEISKLLFIKWIKPLVEAINELPQGMIKTLISKVSNLKMKYETTMVDLNNEINSSEKELCSLLDDLDGNEFDMKGLQELKKLLGGE